MNFLKRIVSPPGISMSPEGFFFKYRPCHSTTGGQIATRIVALTPSMKKIHTAKSLVNFGPVTPEMLWLICMGSDFREANIIVQCAG